MKKILFALFALLVICGVAYYWQTKGLPNSMQISEQNPALKSLQSSIKNVVPHFLAEDSNPTSEEKEIRQELLTFLSLQDPQNAEYYSDLDIRAVGSRYVVYSQPSSNSYYDVIFDTQTGSSTSLKNGAQYNCLSVGGKKMICVGYKDVYTYTLDQPNFVLLEGSQLSGSEVYHSGASDFGLVLEESHTDSSIKLSVFDETKTVQNPEATPNAMQTMSKKVREVTYSF